MSIWRVKTYSFKVNFSLHKMKGKLLVNCDSVIVGFKAMRVTEICHSYIAHHIFHPFPVIVYHLSNLQARDEPINHYL
jgi:hypothetical protein